MSANPWLAIPLEDYESHMALPEVGQAQMLAAELAQAASRVPTRSVAVIGCSGGNGLSGLPAIVRRVVAIDINPAYIAAVRQRFSGRGAVLETFVADIQKGLPACAPVDLVYAGLIFEYVDVSATMAVLRELCTPEGRLVAVIQTPSESGCFVSPTPFSSLQSLQGFARTRSRSELRGQGRAAGLRPSGARRIKTPGGKSFDVLVFQRERSEKVNRCPTA